MTSNQNVAGSSPAQGANLKPGDLVVYGRGHIGEAIGLCLYLVDNPLVNGSSVLMKVLWFDDLCLPRKRYAWTPHIILVWKF